MKPQEFDFFIDTIKLEPLNPNSSMRDKTNYRCLLCGVTVCLSGKYLRSRYKKYGSVGCAECNRNRTRKDFIETVKQKLSNNFYLLSDIMQDTKNLHKDKITVKSKTCGHTFSTVVEYLIHKNVKCPICENNRRVNNKFIDKNGNVVKKKIKYSVKDIQTLLDKTEYKCLDYSEYSGLMSKLYFVCPKGHRWRTVTRFVVLQGVGCPECSSRNYSKKCIEWLNGIANKECIHIQHAENGGEKLIVTPEGKRYYVDGFCEENNTIYEFHGSKYHGDPALFDENDTPHPYNKTITSSELYNKTLSKEKDLIAMGYNVVVMWESEYDKHI